MNTIQDIIWHLYGACVFVRQVLGYIRFFISALLSSRAALVARLLAAESQLTIYKHRINHKKKPRPRFHPVSCYPILGGLHHRYHKVVA
jgi:hypothetical protein